MRHIVLLIYRKAVNNFIVEFIILLSFASALSWRNSNSEITDQQKHKLEEIYINLEPHDYQII